jgi:hypothetical protein
MGGAAVVYDREATPRLDPAEAGEGTTVRNFSFMPMAVSGERRLCEIAVICPFVVVAHILVDFASQVNRGFPDY